MKMTALILAVVATAYSLEPVSWTLSLELEESNDCPSVVELDGNLYYDAFGLSTVDFIERLGAFPPGLTFKYTIKDSLLYIVEAGICFKASSSCHLDCRFPEDVGPIRVPLKVIFPEATSDTFWASYVTADTDIFWEKMSGFTLLVQNGRVFRIYRHGKHGEKLDDDWEKFTTECDRRTRRTKWNSQAPRYLELMKRLKPYYGEKLWKKLVE